MITQRNVLVCDQCHENVAFLVPVQTSIPMSPEKDICFRCLWEILSLEGADASEEMKYSEILIDLGES